MVHKSTYTFSMIVITLAIKFKDDFLAFLVSGNKECTRNPAAEGQRWYCSGNMLKINYIDSDMRTEPGG